ncbi:MAG: hypothetical protein ACXIT4_05475 [Erythrobacter sp.]
MMRKAAAVIALAAMLASCDGPPGTSAADARANGPTLAGPIAPGAPEPEANTIPAQFLGAWDTFEGACEEWSDMRLEIEARRLTFYESTGQVTGVAQQNDITMVDVAMEGEGEMWTDRFGLRLSTDGAQLVVIDPEQPQAGEMFPRMRCPG